MAAADDLDTISDYLYERFPSFREKSLLRIYQAAKSLRRFPERGRLGRSLGTRELVLAPLPYLIIYSLSPEHVQLIRIIHGSQDWPPLDLT